MNRTTSKDIRILFDHVAKRLGFPAEYRLDYQSINGGWVIVCTQPVTYGEFRPFGEGRRSTKEMESYLRGMLATLSFQEGHVSDGLRR